LYAHAFSSLISTEEKFEDTKGIIRSLNWRSRQTIQWPKEKGKQWTNDDV